MSLRIEWDVNKEEVNRRKHRVSFSLASEIFLDPLMATVLDLRHPVEEMRFFSIGAARAGRLLSVGHSDDGMVVRIITARDATDRERGIMKKAIDEDEMPAEIDFSNAERGRFASRIGEGVTMVLLEPDVTEFFPDSEAVNAALRLLLRAGAVAAGEAVQQRQRSK